MEDIGTILKNKRQELGLSISEASLSTKISPKVLNAIESGAKDSLPALPFAKGFVRSYAQYLKLDPEEILSQFLKEIGDTSEIIEAPTRVDNAVSNAVDVTDEDGGGGTRFLVIGGVVVLIGLIVGVKSLIDKYQKEAAVSEKVEVTAIPIEENESKEAASTETAPVEEEKSEKPTEPTASGGTAIPDAEKVASAPATTEPIKPEAAKPAEPAPATAATPPPQKPAEPAKPVEAAKPIEPTKPVEVAKPAEPIKPVAPAKPNEPAKSVETPMPPSTAVASGISQEVIIEALDGVTISVNLGSTKKQIKLKAGDTHILRTTSKIAMDISDGGAVNLTYNGRNRGVPGALGQAKKVSFP